MRVMFQYRPSTSDGLVIESACVLWPWPAWWPVTTRAAWAGY